MPLANSDATASREIRSPSFSSRWISIRWLSRSLKPRSPASAVGQLLAAADEDVGERQRLLHRRLDLVEAEEVGRLLDVVDDVVDLRREAVDVLAVERGHEGRVEALDDVVGDPVALLLGLEDLPVQALGAVGPVLEHLLEQFRPSAGRSGPTRGAGRRTHGPWGEAEADHHSGISQLRPPGGCQVGSVAANTAISVESRPPRPRAARRHGRPRAAAGRPAGPGRGDQAPGSRRSGPDRGRAAVFVPCSIVIGRSVLSRSVKQGTPR